MGHRQFGFVLMGMLSSPSDVRRFEIISPRQVCEELASENCPQFASSCYYYTYFLPYVIYCDITSTLMIFMAITGEVHDDGYRHFSNSTCADARYR
jgi:hypothetical protein